MVSTSVDNLGLLCHGFPNLRRMLRFFRKIRQSLLQSGQTTKYVKYALGEIVLVVIGILIALQINNWNEKRILERKELTLLREMKSNLQEDLIDLDFNIAGTEMRLNSSEIILKVINQKLPDHDSLRQHFGKFMGSYQLTNNTAAFDNLSSIGFDLVRNDSLRMSITRLYSNRYAYLRSLEMDTQGTFVLDQLMPTYRAVFTTEVFWESAQPNDFEAICSNGTFREQLVFHIFIFKYMHRIYSDIKAEVEALREQIRKEVEGR